MGRKKKVQATGDQVDPAEIAGVELDEVDDYWPEAGETPAWQEPASEPVVTAPIDPNAPENVPGKMRKFL